MNLTELLFHTPWWLPSTLAGLGIILFWTGNNRQELRLRNGGLALLGLALLVVALSYFIDTDLEKATKNTRRLVVSVEKHDWNTARSLLDPRCSLAVLNSGTPYNDRDKIIGGAEAGVEKYGLKNIIITSTDAQQADTLITITMDVLTEQDFTGGRPLNSSWQFDWQRTASGWSLMRITCLKIGQSTGEQARVQFPNPKH